MYFIGVSCKPCASASFGYLFQGDKFWNIALISDDAEELLQYYIQWNAKQDEIVPDYPTDWPEYAATLKYTLHSHPRWKLALSFEMENADGKQWCKNIPVILHADPSFKPIVSKDIFETNEYLTLSWMINPAILGDMDASPGVLRKLGAIFEESDHVYGNAEDWRLLPHLYLCEFEEVPEQRQKVIDMREQLSTRIPKGLAYTGKPLPKNIHLTHDIMVAKWYIDDVYELPDTYQGGAPQEFYQEQERVRAFEDAMKAFENHSQIAWYELLIEVSELRKHMESGLLESLGPTFYEYEEMVVQAILAEATGDSGLEGISSPMVKTCLQVLEAGGVVVGWSDYYPEGVPVVYWRHEQTPVFE